MIHRLKSKADIGVVDSQTDLVIEGFPRSGNTFSVALVRALWGDRLSLAHHIHGDAQFARAFVMGVPAILLLRHPVDACASLLVRQSSLTVHCALSHYVRFHRRVSRWRRGYDVISFETLTKTPQSFVSLCAEKLGLDKQEQGLSGDVLERAKEIVQGMNRNDSSRYRDREQSLGLPREDGNALLEKRKRMIIGQGGRHLEAAEAWWATLQQAAW